MKFTPVDYEIVKEIPVRRNYKKLYAFFEEFLNAEVKAVEVNFDERDYKNINSCCNGLRKSVRRGGFPIYVVKRGERIFLINKSI